MTRNTFFAAIAFAAMAIVPNNMMADNHGHNNNGRGYSLNISSTRGTHYGTNEARPGNYDMHRNNSYDMHRYDNHNGYREMHGHRWSHDGWMEGYHGRVRHFDDGRWAYLRDGRWYYYNRFIEPDYYYGRPISHFNSYTYTKAEKAAIGITVGAVAVAALIGALAH